MASALSAFVKGDKEIKDRLESMDSTLKKIYTAQENYYKAEDKHRRRQEQAAKRAKADTKAPGSIFKNKGDKEDKKKGSLLGKLFGGLLKNPTFLKFLAAVGGATVAIIALKKAFEDLKNGTVIWWREVKRQWEEGLAEQRRKWNQWWDDFKVKSSKGWDNFKTKANKLFDDIANSRSFKDFKRGFQEMGKAFNKKFPGISKSLDDVTIRFKKLGKGITKKGGLIDVLTNNKISKGLSKGMRGLGKRLPVIGELIFAGVTAKERASKGQSAGQVALGTGAEVTGGLAGAALGGKAGAALGATIGSFIAPGIGTAIGGALGGFSGAVLGGFGGAEFLGGLADKLYPMISQWVQDTIVAPFSNLMQDIGKFWQVNVVEPFLANPVVQWLTPIVQAAIDLGKAFFEFQKALAGFLGRAAKKWFTFVGDLFKGAWNGITDFNKKLVDSAGKVFGWIGDKFDAWYKKDVEPWWKGLTEGITEFLEPVRKHFEFVGEKAEQLGNFLKDTVLGTFETLTDLLQKGLIGMLDAPKNALNWLTGKLTGKQTGGPINVPGSGSGDKVPMMLPSGSFVMNRNAVHRQEGGMIPTLLEPGEQVYMPGQWGGMQMMMNSMFPRFQTGGEVAQVNHPATGSGYQPAGATDSHGRPIVFSKEAAESFAKMMATGNVRGSDVASSKRSPADNKRVGGVPNSAHLYGEAMDIHGSSKQWLIGNSEKYGWVRNNYMHDSWHWDYKGGGGGQEPPSGPAPMILAAGTNDWGQPVPAGKNVHDMIKVAKGKNYDVNFISPVANGKFAEVSQQTSQQARVAGANTYMPAAWAADGYHIQMAEAAKIKDKFAGSTIIGDSNAARIEGTSGTAGRTKVGAQTSEIKGFIEGLGNGQANENGENGKLGNAITAGNIGSGLLNLGGDLGEFFGTLLGGLGEILGDLGGALLGGLANYGNNGGGYDSSNDNGTSSYSGGGSGIDKGVNVAKSLMKDTGINAASASGIVGNFLYESGGMKPDIREGGPFGGGSHSFEAGRQSTPAGYGWAQWSFDRHDEFVNRHLGGFNGPGGTSTRKATDEDNYKWLLHEFRNKEPIDGIPSDTPANAARWFRKKWERAGVPADGKRIGPAEQVFKKLQEEGADVQKKQSGGAVSAKPVSSSMMNKSQEQFLDKLTSAQTPIIVPMPVGGGGNAGQAHGGAGGGQTNVPDLPSHPSGNVALDNAFRLSLGASFA